MRQPGQELKLRSRSFSYSRLTHALPVHESCCDYLAARARLLAAGRFNANTPRSVVVSQQLSRLRRDGACSHPKRGC